MKSIPFTPRPLAEAVADGSFKLSKQGAYGYYDYNVADAPGFERGFNQTGVDRRIGKRVARIYSAYAIQGGNVLCQSSGLNGKSYEESFPINTLETHRRGPHVGA